MNFLRMAFVVILVVSMLGTEAYSKQVTVKIAMEEGRMADVARYAEPIFEKSHPNINVEVIGLPYTDMPTKLLTVLSAGTYVYDGLEFHPTLGTSYVKSGWLLPLDKWWDEGDPYYSDFLLVDIVSKFEGAPAPYEGTYYGLPFNSDVKMLVYRKDLYEQYGLTLPKTWQEFVYNCVKLNDPRNRFYGFGYPAHITGGGDANTAFMIQVWSVGGQFLDENVRPTFFTPTNLRATQELVDWVPLITQPGRFETGYAEENELFASGKVAHIIQWMPAAAGTIEDPSVSVVVGKAGYAPIWGTTRATGWATGIAITSPHPEETFEFLKFLSGPEMCKEALIRYGNSLVRKTLVNDKDLIEQAPYVPGVVGALKNSTDMPAIPECGAIRDVIGRELIGALLGKITAEQALRNMDEQVEELLRDAGYYK